MYPNLKLLKAEKYATWFILLIFQMIVLGECGLYREWKAKLNIQALSHFINPAEVFRTASGPLTVFFLSGTIFTVFFFGWAYSRWFSAEKTFKNISIQISWKKSIPTFLILAAAWVISIRGGLQQIPIQNSDPYFCSNQLVNDAAVNPFWNLAFEAVYFAYNEKVNPYQFYSNDELKTIYEDLYQIEKDTSVSILKIKKPNLVFLILESWSANCVKAYGGDDYAPFLDSLSHTGIRFTNFYPAGYVSDQGISALLSGCAAAPRVALINQNSKLKGIPCINQDLKKSGYSSGFVFGGDLNYGNLRSYLFNKGWERVVEEKDLSNAEQQGSLGIHDGYMAQVFLKELNIAKAPFVYSWFTVSTHIPYDFPGEKKNLTELENNYTNAIQYSDNALRSFFDQAKRQGWYDSTLFIICADHSHGSHKDHNPCTPEYNQIPFCLFGEVIKEEFRDKEIKDPFSQLDIPYTLLKQLGLHKEAKSYVWSKDIFNPYSKKFALFCTFNTVGWMENQSYLTYNFSNNNCPIADVKDSAEYYQMKKHMFGLQQITFEDYLRR